MLSLLLLTRGGSVDVWYGGGGHQDWWVGCWPPMDISLSPVLQAFKLHMELSIQDIFVCYPFEGIHSVLEADCIK